VFVDVADDADDLCPGFAIVQGDATADGILIVPVTPSDGLRDDGNLGAFRAIVGVEIASVEQGNARMLR